MEVYFEEHEIENTPGGQATMTVLESTRAAPDESWCIGDEKQWPDIVLEIALTSGGLDIPLIERCVAIPRWLEARREFRAGLIVSRK